MSGHSKWANIKRGKSVNDAKKSQTFTKMSRLITVAAKKGGGDPDANAALRLAIEKAKFAKMPKENIDRAIAKGTGQGQDSGLEEVVYEAFGPESGAILIHGVTDNKNRTVSELKFILAKHHGSLGSPGSTSYIFKGETKEPTFFVELDASAKERVQTLLAELDDHDDIQELFTNYLL